MTAPNLEELVDHVLRIAIRVGVAVVQTQSTIDLHVALDMLLETNKSCDALILLKDKLQRFIGIQACSLWTDFSSREANENYQNCSVYQLDREIVKDQKSYKELDELKEYLTLDNVNSLLLELMDSRNKQWSHISSKTPIKINRTDGYEIITKLLELTNNLCVRIMKESSELVIEVDGKEEKLTNILRDCENKQTVGGIYHTYVWQLLAMKPSSHVGTTLSLITH